MNKKYICLLTGAAMVMMAAGSIQAASQVTAIPYNVTVPDQFKVPYEKATDTLFPKGFPTGFGSAVTFKGYNNKGEMQFYGLTDRGPNGDAPEYTTKDGTYPAKYFPSPQFVPSIGVITLTKDGAYVEEVIQIKDATGKPVSGLPIQQGQIGSTGEVGITMDMKKLPFDREGIDPEGIAVDKDGNFWISDEYGPFLIKLDKTGKILEKYSPGNGLPEVLKYRMANRGAEGLTITPSGKVLVAMQSVLDVKGETSKTAAFTRIVSFDPKTKQTKTYGYPIHVADYKSSKDCKIGDIVAIDDDNLLVIEQGKGKDGKMSNIIYHVKLAGATDLTGKINEGKELEYTKDLSQITGINLPVKTPLVDLRAYGWKAEKAEGICLLPDGKTLAVINDNDFGLGVAVTDTLLKDTEVTKYNYQEAKGEYIYEGKEKGNPTIKLVENTEPGQLWTITFANKLK